MIKSQQLPRIPEAFVWVALFASPYRARSALEKQLAEMGRVRDDSDADPAYRADVDKRNPPSTTL